MDITEVPMLTAAKIVKKKEAKSTALRRCCILMCMLFTITSVAAHALIAVSAFGFTLRDEMKEILILSVLPRYSVTSKNTEEKNDGESTETFGEADPSDHSTEHALPSTEEDADISRLLLKNETSYNPDLQVLYNSPNPIDKADKLYERYLDGSPLVLIYHSHATESYCDTNDTGSFRSTDVSRNTVAIGDIIFKCLEANGIKAVHLREMFDLTSYNDAYYNSAAAVEKTLEQYPSIQYILDIHRDSITDEAGNNASVDFSYNGKAAAQLMFVVGTDEGGSSHTEWRQNLTSVLHLQELLISISPSSVRPVNLRKASFFQDRSPGAMLVEVGSCGNTIEEAKRSAAIFSSALSEYILGKKPPMTAESLLRIAES
ncbi:MAG: stage II sporulation protein P [Clostridia bacterium]|nr:stage II sporulation protein P [Clostridia bacterium]